MTPAFSRVWDKSLAKSTDWLKELAAALGWDDPHLALQALRSVLHALRDRLPPDEAADLASQLPSLIKGVYFDGWDPSATPVKYRTAEEFLAVVRRPFHAGPLVSETERVTRAVFTLLARHVTAGEIGDVRGSLPAELAELWPAGLSGRA
jgi:uncharacterized protein (DUF2267 family)